MASDPVKPGTLGRLLAQPLLGVVWIYRRTFSPLLGVNCRFAPTCSEYAAQALREYGGIAGGWLAAKRICRCHPWGGSGYDPVPERRIDRDDAG
ncbi:MAG: membrane protein insertion efficiency factor YidD [Woeseiaceae bacterium]